jgi:hypothetical protein
MEKWQIPSCIACHDRYGKLERDLIGRLGLALDASNAASAGLAEKALRAINPDAAKSEGDAAARDARAKKILREMYKGEELKAKNVLPGLGERWDRPLEEQLGISIPEGSLPAMTEKIVRGITFRENNAFIEPDQKIDFFLVKDEDVKDVKEMLDRAGKEFKRNKPGRQRRDIDLARGTKIGVASDSNGRSSAEKSGEPSLCKALTARSPVGKVDHQIAAAVLRERMRDKFGGFSGRIVTELPPAVVLHDPVVEAVVRHDVNGRDRH